MAAGSDNESSTVSHSAIEALERLAHPRYGRDAPSLNWSIAKRRFQKDMKGAVNFMGKLLTLVVVTTRSRDGQANH